MNGGGRKQLALVAWALALSLLAVAPAEAQHSDVLVQSAAGKLITGSADFDGNEWSIGRRVFFGEFDDDYAVSSPGFNALGAGSPSLPPGAESLPGNKALGWDFLPMTIEEVTANLFYWDGMETDGHPGLTPADVVFGPLPGPEYRLSLFDQSQAKLSVDGSDQIVPGGVIDQTGPSGNLHAHRFFLLENGNGGSPVDGIYLFAMQLRMESLEISAPILVVFGTSGSDVAALDSAAIPWAEANINDLFPQPFAGDYNGDGVVDAADYTVWRDSLGQMVDIAGEGADGDGSGTIDALDYLVWRDNFGRSLGHGSRGALPIAMQAAGVAPEPSSLVLMSLGWAIASVALRRRNDRGARLGGHGAVGRVDGRRRSG